MREMHSKRPKFSKFSGGACPRTPLEARALRRSLKTPSASFNISPPTSQILPSTPFLIENPALEKSSPFHIFYHQECPCHSSFYWFKYNANRPFALRGHVTSLVELALAERDSKNAGVSFCSSSVVPIHACYWFLYYFHEFFSNDPPVV